MNVANLPGESIDGIDDLVNSGVVGEECHKCPKGFQREGDGIQRRCDISALHVGFGSLRTEPLVEAQCAIQCVWLFAHRVGVEQVAQDSFNNAVGGHHVQKGLFPLKLSFVKVLHEHLGVLFGESLTASEWVNIGECPVCFSGAHDEVPRQSDTMDGNIGQLTYMHPKHRQQDRKALPCLYDMRKVAIARVVVILCVALETQFFTENAAQAFKCFGLLPLTYFC